jgi:hypothetical protein
MSVAVATGCTPSSSEPPASGGTLPRPSDVGTLLPVELDTLPSDVTTTLLPDTLFSGDPCTALEEGDFARVTFAGIGTGELIDFGAASLDSCLYTVEAGDEEFAILVRARTAADLGVTSSTDIEVEELIGIGEAAVGIERSDAYEVIVEVSNGWFSVTAPDAASAKYLARVAVDRALQDESITR